MAIPHHPKSLRVFPAMVLRLHWDKYSSNRRCPFLYKNSVSSVAQTRTRSLFNSMAGRGSPAIVSPSVTHLLYCLIFLQPPISRSQDLCSAYRSKARTRDLHPALRYAECTAASGPLFIAGAERSGVHTVLVLNVLGNLWGVVRLSKGPGHNLVRKLCHDITFGLAALHRQRIVHGGMYQLARRYPLTIRVRSPRRKCRDLLAQFEQPPPPEDILDHFGNPQCTIVLPTRHSAHPGAIPPYLVPPISVVDYLNR